MIESLPKPQTETPPAKPLRGSGRRPARLPAGLSLLALVVSALLSSVFWYQARYDTSFRDYTYPWTAHWISSPYHANTACFRKTITVDGPIRAAYVVVAADNFYELRVNGAVPSKRVLEGRPPALLGRQTTYSEIGYGRRDNLGSVYNIGALLLPGRNTITVVVQSDEPQQRLLLQGAYVDSMHHDLASDASWRCSPAEQEHNDMPWYLPQFSDAGWPQAHVQEQATGILVDSDVSLFETPVQGYFVGAPHPSSAAGTTQFRRTLFCPGTVTQGWIRVNWWYPYDLAINGQIVGSTSSAERYGVSPFTRRLEWDTLRRAQSSGTNSSNAYPSGQSANNTDIYLVRDIMHRGSNEIEVTLHTDTALGEKPVRAFNLNADFLHDTGARQLLVTDQRWQVFDAQQWVPAAQVYAPSALTSGHGRTVLREWLSPTSWKIGRVARNWAVFVLIFLAAGYLIGRLQTPRLEIGTTFIAPAVVLAAALVLQGIFSETQQTPFVVQPVYAAAVLVLAAAVWITSAALSILPAAGLLISVPGSSARTANRYGFALGLGLIAAVSALFCFARLNASDFLPDEYVSLLAARGVLRHGIPLYEQTNIIYTRSALYHYLLALFLWVGGSTTNAYAARSLSGCWQVATVVLVYFFGRDVKSRWTGLIAAALVGLSPFMIFYAREARFYTQFAFFSTLCFYFLWKSVREPGNAKYKIGLGLAFIGGYLSQELMILTLPAIVVVVFLAGQTRQYLRGAGLAALVGIFGVAGLDYILYAKYCQTPLPYVDSDSLLLLAFHVDGLDLMPSMLLVSNERSQMAVGGLYLLGLAYLLGRAFIRRPAGDDMPPQDSLPQNSWHWWNYLYLVSVLTIVATTLFTPRPSPRYIINSLPLVALAAAAVMEEIVRRSQGWIVGEESRPVRSGQWISGLLALSLAALCLLAYRPLRLWNNTGRKDSMSTTAAALYVKNHLQPGDKIFFCSPELAMMEIGRCDYFWRIDPSSIYTYIDREGVLRERNSGAVAVNSIDKLRDVVTQNPRVWLVVPNLSNSPQDSDTESFRMNSFVHANYRLVDQEIDNNVYLWDRSRNHYDSQSRASGEDTISFSLQ